ILEEILFRGVLYRQLRTATARWRIGWGVTCSTLVVAIVFAAIHPQGLLAVPALAMIAVGLGLMREWRGSLLAPMVMHGCSNGVVITMLVLVTR
ncbi:MAG: CPBP family intramembrane metalloprotease, partial [Phycisphaerales bacterium]|nr:CPBP family intramembrane metalloprotease [Phycisphaerales bacterium]